MGSLLFALGLGIAASLLGSIASLAVAVAAAQEPAARSYIVHMDNSQMPDSFQHHQHWYASLVASAKDATTDSISSSSATTISDDLLLHVYDTVLHGFSAVLTPTQAEAIQRLPGFVAMAQDTKKELHTTHSPGFLHLNSSYGLWPKSKYGDDVIIGVFDTGVWPESASFSDHRMSAIPSKWKGICQTGPGFESTACNKKLIGARYFFRGYEAMSGPINGSTEFKSPRDSDGHGTHTASTAGGRYVYRADMLGFASGTAEGMAPKARIAVYKVCWTSGCFDSDILAAFDTAVADGVDVISLSVGGGVMPYRMDSIALGAFGAMTRGVFVATSGGNQGPGQLSVTNVAPWIATIGASTMDRAFPATVKLGNGESFQGVSLYSGKGFAAGEEIPLVYSADASVGKNGSDSYSASLCLAGSLDPKLVRGKIVLCDRGNNARVEKGGVVLAAGGRGMILSNSPTDGEGLIADSHLLPATAVGNAAGSSIKNYIKSAKSPVASIKFLGTVLGTSPAPVVASFSSRGPNPETPEILKPDMIAPGVNILAAWTGAAGPTGLASDTRKVRFNIISGTSMACPHVSGLAALLRGAHPDWSPAAIKSALMTSATLVDNTKNIMSDEATGNVSTPFDFGSGLVNPETAMDPGLVYDLGREDYIEFLCSLNYSSKDLRMVTRSKASCPTSVPKTSDLNYPSFSAVFDQSVKGPMKMSFKRTVTNVGSPKAEYVASVLVPKGIEASVVPKRLLFSELNQKLSYTLTISAPRAAVVPGDIETVFGLLTWSDSQRMVRSPIAISRQEPY
ncbi:subtilisin-like protease SBT1.5 [Selaginella moellendorffii]|nr:subtilisin-like protease SBT1.5 [Selaginella moellendorffii]|eukprot:XP_002966443.2 subtilisin-like protease SBT1.5 [Selaginella moellendorffii]